MRRRTWAALARPVPAYAVLAALALPAALWFLTLAHAPTTAPDGPPRLGGYDAAAPLLLHRSIF